MAQHFNDTSDLDHLISQEATKNKEPLVHEAERLKASARQMVRYLCSIRTSDHIRISGNKGGIVQFDDALIADFDIYDGLITSNNADLDDTFRKEIENDDQIVNTVDRLKKYSLMKTKKGLIIATVKNSLMDVLSTNGKADLNKIIAGILSEIDMADQTASKAADQIIRPWWMVITKLWQQYLKDHPKLPIKNGNDYSYNSVSKGTEFNIPWTSIQPIYDQLSAKFTALIQPKPRNPLPIFNPQQPLPTDTTQPNPTELPNPTETAKTLKQLQAEIAKETDPKNGSNPSALITDVKVFKDLSHFRSDKAIIKKLRENLCYEDKPRTGTLDATTMASLMKGMVISRACRALSLEALYII